MKVGIGNEAAHFHLRDYLFRIFGTVSLQCNIVQKSYWWTTLWRTEINTVSNIKSPFLTEFDRNRCYKPKGNTVICF